MKKHRPRKSRTAATEMDTMLRRDHELVMDFCLYFIKECLQNDTAAEVESDDPKPLRDMKVALNEFVDRHRKRIFGYETFIDVETDRTVEEARNYVAYVIDVIQRGDDRNANVKSK